MAVTGLLLIAFLLMHAFGNSKMFLGEDSFNHYAEWLKGQTEDGGILYPLLPAGWFIWIFRVVLLAAVVLHIYSAVTLWNRALAAGERGEHCRKELVAFTVAMV